MTNYCETEGCGLRLCSHEYCPECHECPYCGTWAMRSTRGPYCGPDFKGGRTILRLADHLRHLMNEAKKLE